MKMLGILHHSEPDTPTLQFNLSNLNSPIILISCNEPRGTSTGSRGPPSRDTTMGGGCPRHGQRRAGEDGPVGCAVAQLLEDCHDRGQERR